MSHRPHLPASSFVRFRADSAVAVTLALFAPSAHADEAADTATARALGIEGVTLADTGKCREAIEKLDRAEKLHHAPTTATRLGECEIEVGRLVAGTEHLQRVIRERLPSNAHPAFVAAVARAQKVLDATLPRLSTLRLSVSLPSGTKTAIAIDDEPVSDAIVDSNRRIDPGPHKIVVRAEGFLPASVTPSFGEGETKNVVVELQRAPVTASPKEASRASVTTETGSSKLPAIVAFGLGAVGVGIGIYGAAVVDDKTSSLDARCDANRVCPTDSRRDIDAAKDWATVSTASFIAGGLGVVSGVALLLLARTPEPSTTGGTAVRVRPVLSATALGLDGRF